MAGCTYQVFEDLFKNYLDSENDCKNIYLSQVLPLLPHFVEELFTERSKQTSDPAQKYIFFESELIKTIGFLPKVNRQNVSRILTSPVTLEDTLSSGMLSIMSNDIFVISFKLLLISDEHIKNCQVNFDSIVKLDSVES